MKRQRNEIMEDFVDLCCQLSPENISCDGDLNSDEINLRYRQINFIWKKLENEINSKMTEDDVWKWDTDRRRKIKP